MTDSATFEVDGTVTATIRDADQVVFEDVDTGETFVFPRGDDDE